MGLIAGTLVPASLLAQSDQEGAEREQDVFIQQAPNAASSKVYFPDEPVQSNADPRPSASTSDEEASMQQLEVDGAGPSSVVSQVGQRPDLNGSVDQLPLGTASRVLEQLTKAEREVLLEAVDGTDICDKATEVAAIQALCADRIETRSSEFASIRANRLTSEERLLGEGLDADRLSTLETAIRRLASSTAFADDFSSQAIASAALQGGLSDVSQTASTDERSTGELSIETQSLIDAIVAQFGGNPGSP